VRKPVTISIARAAVTKLDPGRRVIARLFPGSHLVLNTGRLQPTGERRAQQQMIDPEPGIALERIPVIVSEGVDWFIRIKSSQRVGPALVEQPAIGRAPLRREQRIVQPGSGL
jgi:hypothetical protein